MGSSENFLTYEWKNGKISDCDPNYPTELHSWEGTYSHSQIGAHYGFVCSGNPKIVCASGSFELTAGMYFCVNDKIDVQGGKGIIISRLGHNALFQIGGPIEERGRLKYIDGCTDTLLISPVKYGDACLNLLFFPPGIDQTSHTHPSDRIGVVFSGSGECETPEGITPLTPGVIFRIPSGGEHKFRTKDDGMRIVAYHPDSDFGATDENHPMINRTIVDGKSASTMKEIHTS